MYDDVTGAVRSAIRRAPSCSRCSSIARVPAMWSLSTQHADSGPPGMRPVVTTCTPRPVSGSTIGSARTGSITTAPSSGRRSSRVLRASVGSSVSE